MPETPQFEVFLSHFAEEQAVAECVQDYLSLTFGDDLRVFRSSDDGSIRTGADQYPAILQALDQARVYIVLVSKHGATRPWLNFELGYGKARRVDLFTVLIRGTQSGEVPTPLSQMELRPLSQSSVVDEIIAAIARVTGRVVTGKNTNWFLSQLTKREAALPTRELRAVLFRFNFNMGHRYELLGFEIRYLGARAIRLVKVSAELPWTLKDPNWFCQDVTGHLASESSIVNGKKHLRIEYFANNTAPDRQQSGGGWRPLVAHLSPSEKPTFLYQLRFALNPDIGPGQQDEVIRCQVFAEDGVSEAFEYRFGDIEKRSDFRL